jgi:hypothetical protein
MVADSYRDRSVGLVVFGIIEILIGVFLALMIPLIVVAAVAAQSLDLGGVGLDLRTTVVSALVYGAIAVAFIWIGIGSIRARKWARAVMLALSWLWLITGAISMVVFWVAMPRYWEVSGFSDLAPGAEWMVTLSTTGFVGLIYVVLPLAFVGFYRSEHVAATCRARDPDPSWVDDRPQSLVNLVIVCALIALTVLIMPVYNFMFPLCGVILVGWAGAVSWLLVLAATLVFLSAAVVGDGRGWAVAMATSLFVALSTTVTAATVPYSQWLDRMNLPLEQRDMVVMLWNPSRTTVTILAVLFWSTWIIYLLYVKRLFVDRTA